MGLKNLKNNIYKITFGKFSIAERHSMLSFKLIYILFNILNYHKIYGKKTICFKYNYAIY